MTTLPTAGKVDDTVAKALSNFCLASSLDSDKPQA